MHLAARLVLQTVAALLCDVPDVEPGFILIGNLDQFKLRFRYVDGFGGGCFELYSVHVRVAGLVNFLDRADLASLRKCDDVIVNEPRCAHKSLFLVRCRQHEAQMPFFSNCVLLVETRTSLTTDVMFRIHQGRTFDGCFQLRARKVGEFREQRKQRKSENVLSQLFIV